MVIQKLILVLCFVAFAVGLFDDPVIDSAGMGNIEGAIRCMNDKILMTYFKWDGIPNQAINDRWKESNYNRN